MSKTIRLDGETLGTMVNGKFVFTYDWVIRNKYNLTMDKLGEDEIVEFYDDLLDNEKLNLMETIKSDFLLYQWLVNWKELYNELEKEYKEMNKMKLRKLISQEVEKHFKTDEIKVITINSYNDYKEDMYWDDLDGFVNDCEIKVNDLFVESYTAYIMNDIEDYEYDFDIHERMEELYKNEDYFIILNEIVLNKLSK